MHRGIQQVQHYVPPRSKHHSPPQVGGIYQQNPYQLGVARLQEQVTGVEQHPLRNEDYGPPVHVGSVLDEQELPPHLQPRVFEEYWRPDHCPDKQRAETHNPADYTHQPDAEHAVPLLFEADHAAIAHQRLAAVWVRATLEHGGRRIDDPAEEREHQRQVHIRQAIVVQGGDFAHAAQNPEEQPHSGKLEACDCRRYHFYREAVVERLEAGTPRREDGG
mmetsp:Transcript_29099/g.65854  ORF Transcript_29099/g.65854 Transcript_29099/m.65854 type:complete len:219 (-) Transcript_29099:444-1100(-)